MDKEKKVNPFDIWDTINKSMIFQISPPNNGKKEMANKIHSMNSGWKSPQFGETYGHPTTGTPERHNEKRTSRRYMASEAEHRDL